jgi:Domain of unknown function (DUF5060)
MTLLAYLANLMSVFGMVAPLFPGASVPEGQPYDITLTSSSDVVYPIRDVDLIGVFTGPSGRTLVLPGFWDGGRSFRIRFTPTVPGEWNYTTVSSDPALDAQMAMLNVIPNRGVSGFEDRWADGTRRAVAGCVPDCSTFFDASEEQPDVVRLRALDATIAEAQRAGSTVDLRLFARSSEVEALDPRIHGIIEYFVARYAAYPNVVWCAGSSTVQSGVGSRAALRGLVRTLDPYYAIADWRRPVLSSCGEAAVGR